MYMDADQSWSLIAKTSRPMIMLHISTEFHHVIIRWEEQIYHLQH